MFRKKTAVMICVLLSFILCSCKSTVAVIKIPYDVHVGEEFKIISFTGSVYRWENPKFVEEGLEYLGYESHVPNDDPFWFGGGYRHFKFKALKEGRYTIQIVANSVIDGEMIRDLVYELNIIA